MDIIKNPRVEWLNYRWLFLVVSLFFLLAGAISLGGKGLNLGVDFTGGTLVFVRFKERPELDRVRGALSTSDLNVEGVTRFDQPSKNQIQVRMGRISDQSESDLGKDSRDVVGVLKEEYDSQVDDGKIDLNNVAHTALTECLEKAASGIGCDQNLEAVSPEENSELESSLGNEEFGVLARRILDFRTARGGIISDDAELEEIGLSADLVEQIRENFYLGSFTIISVESVGPKVGRELQDKAINAIVFSLLGVLAYIAYRFKFIYGLAAIVALFHDVFITLGLFAFFDKEISLTVIAALLTLVGYSINDTIVIFDRVRENVLLMRRADFGSILNTSINQTLNRTVLTSGMTFLAVLALYLMGGQVLNGFSFALVIGVLVGTYSSIAVASPIVLWWQSRRAG